MAKKKICGIYKISFPNNKVYIGQSVDIYKRYKEHYRYSHPEKYSPYNKKSLPVHSAMAKYEGDYFLEVLEECDRNQLDDKERKWIRFYQSNNREYGYNVAYGGQESFALKGENHSQAKITEKDVKQIKKEIVDRKRTFREIAKEFGVSPATITHINQGKTWSCDEERYPLRSNSVNDNIAHRKRKQNRMFSDDEIRKIRFVRNKQNKTLQETKRILGLTCSISMIDNIASYKNYKDIS